MPPEAWVALILGTVTLFFTIVGATWYLSGQSAKTGTSISSMDERMEAMEKSIDKIEGTLQIVAEQKADLRSLRELVLTNKQEQNTTNERVFRILDDIRGRPAPRRQAES